MIILPPHWEIQETYNNFGKHSKPIHKYYDGDKMICVMELTKGQSTIFDYEDIDIVTKYNWYAKACGKYGFTVCSDTNISKVNGKKTKDTLFLHQLLTGTFKTETVCDHLNFDFPDSFELDNRRCNLKVTNKSVNQKNRRLSSNNTSGFSGVVYSKKDVGYFGRVHHKDKLVYAPLFSEGKFGNLETAKELAILYTETLRSLLYNEIFTLDESTGNTYVDSRIKEYFKRLS